MKLNHCYEILSYRDGSERAKWKSICESFENIDIFFYPEYAKLFELHGDGEPFLFVYYHSPKDIVIYPFLKRSLFQMHDNNINLFDITSPYGYGGYLRNSETVDMEQFSDCFQEYCKENNMISEFIRFHPILENVNMHQKLLILNNTIRL